MRSLSFGLYLPLVLYCWSCRSAHQLVLCNFVAADMVNEQNTSQGCVIAMTLFISGGPFVSGRAAADIHPDISIYQPLLTIAGLAIFVCHSAKQKLRNCVLSVKTVEKNKKSWIWILPVTFRAQASTSTTANGEKSSGDLEICKRHFLTQVFRSFQKCDSFKGGFKPPTTTKTGTTIVGIIFKDGVILGADTRATEGPIVSDKNCAKIHYLAKNI